MRFGVQLFPLVSVEEALKLGKECEKLGFDSVWMPDHIIFSRKDLFSPEAWEVLLSIGLNTNKICVGTVVSDPHRCHPAFMSQRIATISQLLGEGRVILGLGAGESMNLDPYGIPWDKPVSRLEEAIEIIEGLWRATPEKPFSFEGRFFKLSNSYLQVKPKGKVPIYLGANSPRTRKLTGKLADGWLPIGMPPKLYEKKLAEIRSIAKEANRNVEAGILLWTALDRDKKKALETLKLVSYAMVWPSMLEEIGIEVPREYKLRAAFHKVLPGDPKSLELLRKYAEFIPENIIMEFGICGNRRDLEERLEEYIKGGVEHFVFGNFSPDRAWALKEISEVIQFYR